MRMRIIAGTLGGRWFDVGGLGPRTHPTGERVRGGLFNKLGDLTGKTIFDAFGGSGAYAYEAVSRGAASVLITERDPRAQRVIARNIEALNLHSSIKLVKASCSAWSNRNQNKQFDILICDVPYDNMQLSTVSTLIRHLKDNGLMVLSYPGRESAPTVNGVVVVDKSYYGDAALAYYRAVAL